MLGRPPGGERTEVYDFVLYNILACAEPKNTNAFRNLERLGDDNWQVLSSTSIAFC